MKTLVRLNGPRMIFTRADFDKINQAYVEANTILGILPLCREYPIYRVAKVLLARFAPHVKLDPRMEIGPGEDLANFHQWLGHREERIWKPRKKASSSAGGISAGNRGRAAGKRPQRKRQ